MGRTIHAKVWVLAVSVKVMVLAIKLHLLNAQVTVGIPVMAVWTTNIVDKPPRRRVARCVDILFVATYMNTNVFGVQMDVAVRIRKIQAPTALCKFAGNRMNILVEM
ncbi:MAG TPA: hypothetical protein VMW72_18735 [Sedimentisphaerales bacterium]|nr:hypothetical protein [Sedimentisphaerales bacterium]